MSEPVTDEEEFDIDQFFADDTTLSLSDDVKDGTADAMGIRNINLPSGICRNFCEIGECSTRISSMPEHNIFTSNNFSNLMSPSSPITGSLPAIHESSMFTPKNFSSIPTSSTGGSFPSFSHIHDYTMITPDNFLGIDTFQSGRRFTPDTFSSVNTFQSESPNGESFLAFPDFRKSIRVINPLSSVPQIHQPTWFASPSSPNMNNFPFPRVPTGVCATSPLIHELNKFPSAPPCSISTDPENDLFTYNPSITPRNESTPTVTMSRGKSPCSPTNPSKKVRDKETWFMCQEEAESNRRLYSRSTDKQKIVFRTRSHRDVPLDGYRWHKYGEKPLKGNPNPRSYYKCANQGCDVHKYTERDPNDSSFYIVTYLQKHTHDLPRKRNSRDNGSKASSGSKKSDSLGKIAKQRLGDEDKKE